ncbi:MBL fold metallo-hydrolase [Paenibacillus athensensis]|uniref:Metallo-beta-lactamase domain-containing protein n=1 Tax=Paenibacillus athensensis TaxID=1967502 RepID=A0A4Y8Q3T5_9BACL|nr:MBL fold metallo-hydrolase [Paenibacillus athensensis]MCD1260704.1 MBL fold metallo-hydrolase [Paenibacillus athensensis]
MHITILGPWGAYPQAGEATAGYLLETDDNRVLLDCGSGVLAGLQKRLSLDELTHVMITHAHYDHIADLGCLQYACLIDKDLERRQADLPIYMACESGHAEALGHKAMPGTIMVPVAADDTLELGGMTCSFMRTLHGVYCLAVKVRCGGRTLVFTADTSFDEALIPFCAGADLLLAETSFYADQDARRYGHMNAREVGMLAARAGVGKLVLTHLPHFGELEKLVEEATAEFDGEITLASCGMELEL